MKSALKLFDLEITQVVLRLPESWRAFFVFVTSLGDPIVTIGIGIVVAAVGIWNHSTRLFLAGATVWITLLIGTGLKMIFGRARPVTDYAANLRVDTYSFPSGHSSGSMIAYGLLAYLAWKLLPQPYGWIIVGACSIIVFLVGVSRVYLGAHFPSDVAAGWLLGALFLCVIIFIIKPL